MADYTVASLFDSIERRCVTCNALFIRRVHNQVCCSRRCLIFRSSHALRNKADRDTKMCPRCSKAKPFDDFAENKSGPRHALFCKACEALDAVGQRRCNVCKQVKELDAFIPKKAGSDERIGLCRSCSAAKNKEYQNTPEGKRRQRDRYYRRNFRITAEQYDQMVSDRNGLCDVCGKPPEVGKKILYVDHDHACCPTAEKTCGKCIRGLLCIGCNTALGAIRDDPRTAERMIAYLSSDAERRRAQTAA